MIYDFELNNTLPNQTFNTTINNVDMEVIIRTGGSNDNPITFFALLVNGNYLCPFVPVFSNQKVLPYEYMALEIGGNFYFITEGDDYPYFENFNSTCRLVFLTSDELNG